MLEDVTNIMIQEITKICYYAAIVAVAAAVLGIGLKLFEALIVKIAKKIIDIFSK